MLKTFTCIGIKKKHAKHWRLPWFRYETFITFLTFRFLTRGEREPQFLLCWLFHLTRQRAAYPLDPNGLASPSSENQLAPSKFKSQLFWTARPGVRITTAFFFQNTQESQPIASRQTSFKSPVSFSIRVFYYNIYDCHILPRASVNTDT